MHARRTKSSCCFIKNMLPKAAFEKISAFNMKDMIAYEHEVHRNKLTVSVSEPTEKMRFLWMAFKRTALEPRDDKLRHQQQYTFFLTSLAVRWSYPSFKSELFVQSTIADCWRTYHKIYRKFNYRLANKLDMAHLINICRLHEFCKLLVSKRRANDERPASNWID